MELTYCEGERGKEIIDWELPLHALTADQGESEDLCREWFQDTGMFADLVDEVRDEEIDFAAFCCKEIIEEVGKDLQKHIDGDGEWLFAREAELISGVQPGDSTAIET